jgi:hypothetical protein
MISRIFNLFRFIANTIHHTEETMDQTQPAPHTTIQNLTGKMRPLISNTADTLCRSHLRSLLDKSVEYISSAVWGADKHKELDGLQNEISRACGSLERELFDLLDIRGLSPEQDFAIHYFIRELLLVKICFAVEYAKYYTRQLLETAGETWACETMGNA